MSERKPDFSKILIPSLFALGLFAFFIFIPVELQTLDNLIGYLASLSTVIMVLVYLSTNSKQLSAMENQLSEMKFSRNIQYQPLPYVRKVTSQIELPRFYSGPRTKFERMEFLTRLYFDFEIENVGNGPAVEIECEPAILYEDQGIPRTILETPSDRIECLTLKEGTQEKIHFMFLDDDNKILEHMINIRSRIYLHLSFVYKNIMGIAFKVTLANWIGDVKDEDSVKIAESYKLTKTYDFDFRAEREEYTRLKKRGNSEDAKIILNSVNESLPHKEKLDIKMNTKKGSFKVTQIDESEYDRISNRNERIFRQWFEKGELE